MKVSIFGLTHLFVIEFGVIALVLLVVDIDGCCLLSHGAVVAPLELCPTDQPVVLREDVGDLLHNR